MGKRIKAIFHKWKNNKTNKYYIRLVWLISTVIVINIIILFSFLIFLFKTDLDNIFSKIEDSIFNEEKKDIDLVEKDFIFF